MAVNLDDVVKLAEQLDAEQQNLLIYRLRVKQMRERKTRASAQAVEARRYSDEWIKRRGSEYIEVYRSPTRDELIHDVEILRQTPLQSNSALLGKYANPTIPDMTEEEFHAQMHAIATEWEQELDEFYDDKP
ncbi:MAG: hypothetical protein SGJ24_15425 [Chloroflexota bacterium]|nr:hypothetical protein [Chloroflexota bacterium]